MIIQYCIVLSGLIVVEAKLNISNQNYNPGSCVEKILSKITEFKQATIDASIMNNEDDVVKEIQGIKRLRFATRSRNWENNEILSSIYVMNFEDYDEMIKGFDAVMADKYWTPISNFIIILERLDYDLFAITKFLIFHNLYNVTLLKKEENDYTIFTFHSPIHPCNHNPHLIRITRCSKYNGESYIFPTINNKDLRGCRFKFAAKNFYPMVDFDNKNTMGMEQQMMKLFSEQHSMVIELLEYYKIDKLGRIVGNYNYVDMLNMVRSNKVEGVVGGYFIEFSTLGKFSFAYPIRIDQIVLIMPRALFYGAWHAVFHKNFYVIMFILIFIIIFTVLAYFLELFSTGKADATRDLMVVFGYFLNKITVREFKKGIPESLIIGSLLFSVFIINYTIQAFFYSVKTNPIRGVEVKEQSEISDDYQFIVPLDWGNITTNTQNSVTCVSRLDCLNKVMKSKDRSRYTIIGEVLYEAYKWMLIDESCSTDVYKLRDPVSTKMRTVYFRFGSVLVKPFDKFTMNYVSSGLLQKHFADMVLKERLKCRYRAKPRHSPLSLKDMKQSFILLIGGYCLSGLCFAYEVLSKRRKYRL